ncbi:hypothetical protein P389DRAFT_53642 [Cystobasidium minutum MCA 4210]|uniref:uncharacterized protein n=1 Tax=Cystobasidium minutum MCA 4210 TaxID=1397322 RepID=UPI0034CF4B3E|eukprot:jgi/Rhomi1/53642/CE53641_1725
MPVYTGGQHDSPPPSPVCSDTLSLPDGTSDLDILSDCSGISVSDEDERRARSYTESDTEIHTDDDLEEITHSMLASSEIGSARNLRRPSNESTSSVQATNHDRTPSTTVNRSHSSSGSYSRRVGARDLEYPRLFPDDSSNPFGLNSLYNVFKEEREIVHDQDLQDYSVLDVQGESFRPKYERASQTQTDISTIVDSEATLSHLSEFTVKDSANDSPFSPLSNSVWLSGPEADDTARPDTPNGNSGPQEADSLLANWQRCGPRWLNRQTFGIFGVVLLGVAAYHVKATAWGSVDTNSLFINTTDTTVSSQTAGFVAMTNLPREEQVPLATHTESKESVQVTSALPLLAAPPQPTDKLALSSLPSSVSALISMASSGIASLSTHGVSGSSFSSDGRSRREVVESIIAARKRRPRHKQDDIRQATPGDAIQVVSSQIQAPGLSGHTATALSTLPRRAQKGLSILAQRSLPCPGCTANRGTELKAKKSKKQASRRTGSHWINKVETAPHSNAAAKSDIIVNTSIKEAIEVEGPPNSVNVAFSKLTAQKFWAALPYASLYQPKSAQAPAIPLDMDDHSDPLLLDNAKALSQLSFGNMCKQLDGLLLPYAQHVVDSVNAMDYASVWQWIQGTVAGCYQLIAPYIATIDAQSAKHVVQMHEVAANSVIAANHMYADVQAYLRAWQAAYVPLARQFVAKAQNTVKNAKNNVEVASKEVTQKMYGQSKHTVKKARRNAQKLLRKQNKVSMKNKHKHRK